MASKKQKRRRRAMMRLAAQALGVTPATDTPRLTKKERRRIAQEQREQRDRDSFINSLTSVLGEADATG